MVFCWPGILVFHDAAVIYIALFRTLSRCAHLAAGPLLASHWSGGRQFRRGSRPPNFPPVHGQTHRGHTRVHGKRVPTSRTIAPSIPRDPKGGLALFRLPLTRPPQGRRAKPRMWGRDDPRRPSSESSLRRTHSDRGPFVGLGPPARMPC